MSIVMSANLTSSSQINLINDMYTGSETPQIVFYSGPRPSTAGAEPDISSRPLFSIEMPWSPKPGATSAAVVEFTSPSSPNVIVDETGDVAWARILDANGIPYADIDVSLLGQGGDFQMNTLGYTAEDEVTIDVVQASITSTSGQITSNACF